jgi:Tfp pilus assembly protein PilP
MKSMIARVLIALLLGGAAVEVSACGEEEKMERPVDPRIARRRGREAKQAGPAPDALVVIKLDNPKWDLVSPHFKKFLAQKHATPKDAFSPNTTTFIPRPVIAQDDDQVQDLPIEEEIPRGPLEQFPLSEYGIKSIMSGTAVPKAMVVDPKGEAYIIQKDTKMGDKGGIVESITQYMVIVKEPNSEEPVKITIRPPFIDLVSRSDAASGAARRDTTKMTTATAIVPD